MLDAPISHIRRAGLARGGLRAALAEIAKGFDPTLLVAADARIADAADAFLGPALEALRAGSAFGASLSFPRFRPGTRIPVVPLEDGSDVVFGRCAPDVAGLFEPDGARAILEAWPASDADGFARALARLGGFVLLPRSPLACLPGGRGAMRRNLAVGWRDWRIPRPDDALALYDCDWNLVEAAARRLGPLRSYRNFRIDLWGQSAASLRADLMVSARPCRAPILQFPLSFMPLEANLTMASTPGTSGPGFFSLGAERDFEAMPAASRERLFRHATRYNAIDDYLGQFLAPVKRRLAERWR
ncbi:hypothetical protein B2G71_05210 [Novosphingobium sp. PC22D]|uniref:hypothetical protein n=1 Tax=Novosphingobium sp. PC22D TaxID=1962403 RepID=UPI000BFAE4F4|nr:hypothetical protein [Novosphingobium sp. PC22D]PEQ13720.1 hypothetical protein B2G71_05210 [Novosphingobium sp. PC22D]